MNVINHGDVILTLVVLIIVMLGFAFELAGETVKGWHTISWWAHRDKRLRWLILLVGLGILAYLEAFHFTSVRIAR